MRLTGHASFASIRAARAAARRSGKKRRGIGTGAVLLLVSTLGACAVGPDYQFSAPLTPSHWANASDRKAPRLSRWWTRFNDRILDALMEEAVAGNLDVATAKAKIREARATYRQTFGSLFPTLTNSESATRSQTSVASSGTSSPAVGSLYQAGFDASWELDLFGANRRAVEAAAYGVDAAEENLQATLLTLVGDVASYYVQARGYQARIALARRTATSQEETAQITRNKFAAGSTSAVDVANATGQAASTRATIPTFETSYAEVVHSLSILLGKPPAALNERLAVVRPIPAPRLTVPAGIPADVLLNRPDVRLAERQYAQYTAKVGQAEAARYPSASLTGSISTSAAKTGDLGKSSSIGWSFGPTLTVPIFNAGQLEAAVAVAEAQRDQYFIAYKSAVLNALGDVENALVSLAKEKRRTQSLDLSASSYRQASSLSRSLYQSGAAGFLDVLTAERSAFSAEDALIQSRVLIATDYIALNKALGGGWNGAVDASKPEVVDANTGPHLASSGSR
ncbi:RND efflux system, outer membrane lipoprotein, NodT family [Rhodomicrobium vannielii ATCC 17100]|uniref:RND efflux system, outer membrane lipoprotein, NodT family n=1 Tax=Rhodomicrobium vannielii (strain ATCC 17100 / DSM 162 / LMG 4299 / NCIMB 10020 / ATH 3.1.1) TaxID=648757 RepID=E3I1H5_RHOVT|nr:efflux transporter outer membrane subunit [Rhodomicrobium vannielii]ADP71266.1 RND efflux system, outer membrane lipoprotein, NodT family [Rhodomicrobium vannielii ATCC 17100]